MSAARTACWTWRPPAGSATAAAWARPPGFRRRSRCRRGLQPTPLAVLPQGGVAVTWRRWLVRLVAAADEHRPLTPSSTCWSAPSTRARSRRSFPAPGPTRCAARGPGRGDLVRAALAARQRPHVVPRLLGEIYLPLIFPLFYAEMEYLGADLLRLRQQPRSPLIDLEQTHLRLPAQPGLVAGLAVAVVPRADGVRLLQLLLPGRGLPGARVPGSAGRRPSTAGTPCAAFVRDLSVTMLICYTLLHPVPGLGPEVLPRRLRGGGRLDLHGASCATSTTTAPSWARRSPPATWPPRSSPGGTPGVLFPRHRWWMTPAVRAAVHVDGVLPLPLRGGRDRGPAAGGAGGLCDAAIRGFGAGPVAGGQVRIGESAGCRKCG